MSKLGYGGTKEEMKRLIKDASKMKDVQKQLGVTVDSSSMSFDNIINAISVMQGHLGVTGSTAMEAEKTFSGSFSAMKASAQNVLGAMATGGDVEGTMLELISSATTFLAGNAIPMIVRILKSLPTAIKTGLTQVKPQIMQAGVDLLNFLREGAMNFLPTSMQGMAGSIFDGVENIFTNLPTIFEKVKTIFSNIVQATEPIRATLVNIFQQVVEKISTVVEVVQSHMGTFKKIFEAVIPVVQTVLETAWSVISPIIDLGITLFDELMKCVETVFPTIQNIIYDVWYFLEPIFGGIAKGISSVGDAISGIGEFVGGGINTIGSWFGFAYGKDRVPYDNYPARLHAGEKVLTRNQADQYERVMSTRGLQVNGKPLDVSQGLSRANSVGNTVNIEKLADTVVIEKEADVDKVVEGMINKFRKLVPNMA